jgi:hypothetical protein
MLKWHTIIALSEARSLLKSRNCRILHPTLETGETYKTTGVCLNRLTVPNFVISLDSTRVLSQYCISAVTLLTFYEFLALLGELFMYIGRLCQYKLNVCRSCF